jgi:nicotinate-nucleotide--dimethylbenzimidazole phosphoribosyltransferase
MWYQEAVQPPCESSRQAARERQQQLTKPPGSLGELERLAIEFAGWQQTARPQLADVAIRIFAADHGISRQGVSAFPAEVTVQMVENFLSGGAAISVLARAMNADFSVINMGTFSPLDDVQRLTNLQIAPGTEDFTDGPAMNEDCLQACLAAGRDQVDTLQAELFIGGEMGIGNTTSASAILAACAGLDAAQVTGRGTGIDDVTLAVKQDLIRRGILRHSHALNDWQDILRNLGGLEIAALTGAYIRCAQRGIPILLDGYIATCAALLACRANPDVRHWMLAGHRSAEGAHKIALEELGLRPLIELDMRLGEGSGAAVAVALVRSALLLHDQMATFDEAGVSTGE